MSYEVLTVELYTNYYHMITILITYLIMDIRIRNNYQPSVNDLVTHQSSPPLPEITH